MWCARDHKPVQHSLVARPRSAIGQSWDNQIASPECAGGQLWWFGPTVYWTISAAYSEIKEHRQFLMSNTVGLSFKIQCIGLMIVTRTGTKWGLPTSFSPSQHTRNTYRNSSSIIVNSHDFIICMNFCKILYKKNPLK